MIAILIVIMVVLGGGILLLNSHLVLATDDNDKSTAAHTDAQVKHNDQVQAIEDAKALQSVTSSEIIPIVPTVTDLSAPAATCPNSFDTAKESAACATKTTSDTAQSGDQATQQPITTTDNSIPQASTTDDNTDTNTVLSNTDKGGSSSSGSSTSDSSSSTKSDDQTLNNDGVWLDSPTKVYTNDGSQILFFKYSSDGKVGAYITVPGTHHRELALTETGLYSSLEDGIKDLER